MSLPPTIYDGDFLIRIPSDTTQFGYGNLTVQGKVIINSTENANGSISAGSLLVDGGARISKTLHIFEDLNVLYGTTNLTETNIDTNNGPCSIFGANKVDISVGPSSNFVSTGGNLLLESNVQSLQLYGGLNSDLAVDIISTNSAGGIRLLSGVGSGIISFVSGSGGVNTFTSNGNIISNANNGSFELYCNTSTDNQNFNIQLVNSTDSQLKIDSAGNNTTKTALLINTSNTNGNIIISNSNGLGVGSLTQKVGSGGFTVITNTSGTISMTSQNASSNYIVKSSGSNQNLILDLQGSTDSSLIIKSAGNNAVNQAIDIKTINTAGNIKISQPDNSLGKVMIYTGNNGLDCFTQTGGSIIMNAYGASSLYTNSTLLDNQNLTISVSGNTNSKVIIESSGTSNQAIKLETNNSGGILINSMDTISIQSNNFSNGINIGTNNAVPINIGNNSSTININGNLNVRGNTSTIDQVNLTIDDNIIVLNNSPFNTANSGVAVKRYQYANDSSLGDVVSDTVEESGTVINSSNTSTVIHLDSSSNSTDDYYKGWWIKVISGTGAGQVRKIKSYNGTSKLATIYSSADQISNPLQPVEGMDLLTILDNTSVYNLYPCQYTEMLWDESLKEFSFVCSATDPNANEDPIISHYSNLHINNLLANDITVNSINGSVADITTYVTLTNNSTSPVSITGLTNNYGIYKVLIKPNTLTSSCYAEFSIGRTNNISLPGTIHRIMSVRGSNNESLDIQWSANSMPELFFRQAPGGIGTTVFKLRFISL